MENAATEKHFCDEFVKNENFITNFKFFKKSDEKELTSGSRSGKISKQIERGAARETVAQKTLKEKRKNILKKVLKTLDRREAMW